LVDDGGEDAGDARTARVLLHELLEVVEGVLELLQFQTAHGAEPDHQPVVVLVLLQEVQFVRFPADSRHLLGLVVPVQNPHELSYRRTLDI